jgi:trigger factor
LIPAAGEVMSAFLMQVNVQRISPVVMELQVEVPADLVKQQIDKAYVSLGKKAHI